MDVTAMDCKLCFKRFSNGKALGAHMRSHYAILPLPPKSRQVNDDNVAAVSDVGDGESKRISDRELAEPRLKRLKNDDREEDVALCLIMLSRDAWREKVYRCEKCDKVFKSSQGLGSHKASHLKRIDREKRPEIADGGEDHQVHECALCSRNFKSAQALGGHKRSHLQALKFGGDLVDLNLPPAAAAEVVNEEIVA